MFCLLSMFLRDLYLQHAKEINPRDMRRNIFILFLLIAHLPVVGQKLNYPDTKIVSQTDVYHGVTVNDPYRWLEDDHSAETKNWVDAQNKVTFDYLTSLPEREKNKARLTKIWSFPRQSSPSYKNGNYYYYKNNGTQNQSVLYKRNGIKGKEEMILDPNFLSADGTTSITLFQVSNDGKYAAYGISKGGSDWTEVKVIENASGRELAETIKWIKFSGISWQKDGFFYSRYDEPSGDAAFKGKNEFHKVYYHKAGTPQSSDNLIYADPENPLRNFGYSVSKDERFHYITGSQSSSGNSLTIKSAATDKSFKFSKAFKYSHSVIDNIGNSIFILTNENASRKKVVKFDFETGQQTVLIPEKEEVLLSLVRAGNNFVAHYMKDASSRLYVYDTEGKFKYEIKLPTYCTLSSVNGSDKDSLLFYSVVSFTFPETTYMHNLNSKSTTVYFQPQIDFDANGYETKQVFYKSKDNTSIPMFIVYKKGLIQDGNNPTLLFGYGGFNISKTPEFITERLLFLEKGGVFAMPNLRGGGEFGEAWHEAGTKLKKQNVFDDFISAAEYLISEKYTTPAKLAIGGRSNGGLLVGAALTQRPELFKVALPAVGVMDMLRFHKFTIGWAWTGDYGSSDKKEEFEALFKYSPLHNIKENVKYPATLVTTADHDDRVVPAHSFKFISTLQQKQSGENPVLIRIDVNAGHGSGKPVSKLIDEQSDIFTFMMHHLGMD
jgi:prolyl oligopeptidase